jgi:hypothetical protein
MQVEAITQLLSGELSTAPSRPEGHARTTRVGGAKRRALHGAERSSKLEYVIATDHADAGQPFADDPDDR